MTIRELEVELDPKGGTENCLPESPTLDVETWLDWQVCQLNTPTWWLELRAILGVKDLQKLAHKIWVSSSIPKVRMRAIPGQEYTVLPAPKCLNRNTFLLDKLSYQDVWQQPVLLTVTYARGLQYWAEKHNLLESPDFHPLVGGAVELREAVREHVTFTNWDVLWGLKAGAVELREAVREHVTFTNWDVLWGLGAVNPGATDQWPQTSMFS